MTFLMHAATAGKEAIRPPETIQHKKQHYAASQHSRMSWNASQGAGGYASRGNAAVSKTSIAEDGGFWGGTNSTLPTASLPTPGQVHARYVTTPQGALLGATMSQEFLASNFGSNFAHMIRYLIYVQDKDGLE